MLSRFFVLLGLLLPWRSLAQEPAQTLSPAMWVVRDADSTLYLFGTVHLRKPGDAFGSKPVVAALDSAEEVWTEIVFGPDTEKEVLLEMAKGCPAPKESLFDALTKKERRAVIQATEGSELPYQVLDHLTPWCATMTLTSLSLVQSGFDSKAGVDMMIDQHARAAGKRMRGLETVADEMKALSGGTREQQIEGFKVSLTQIKDGPTSLGDIVDAWTRGDVDALNATVVQPIAKYPEAYSALLVERNTRWVETLTAELAGSGVDFVAVGAGHLVGADSVVALLQARGFVVERVDTTDVN